MGFGTPKRLIASSSAASVWPVAISSLHVAFQADLLILYVKQLSMLLERVSDDLGVEVATLKKRIAVLEKNNKTLQQRLDKSELLMKEGQYAMLLESFFSMSYKKPSRKSG